MRVVLFSKVTAFGLWSIGEKPVSIDCTSGSTVKVPALFPALPSGLVAEILSHPKSGDDSPGLED